MSRKRRMFEIDPPPEVETNFPAAKSGGPRVNYEMKSTTGRRGPMATAIGETGGALRLRKSMEADIRAENDALAHEFVRLKKAGPIVDLVPLDLIDSYKLTRDRSVSGNMDLADLKASLRDVGVVEPDSGGAIDWRAFRADRGNASAIGLPGASGGDRRRPVGYPCGASGSGRGRDSALSPMVDENMVRKDISFAEMATPALAYADDHVGGCADVDEAVNRLYASASPQKRTYIRRFAVLLRRIGKSLSHPEAIPRVLGLRLTDLVEGDVTFMRDLSDRLRAEPARDTEGELAILRAAVDG